MKPAYEALKKARYIVATRWRKGSMGVPGGPRCALGALAEVTYEDPSVPAYFRNPDAREAANDVYKKAVGILYSVVRETPRPDLLSNGGTSNFLSVPDLNDSASTTQDLVVETFSKAIRKAR